MRRTCNIWLIAGAIFFLSACNKATTLSREAKDSYQSVVEAPSPEAKSDRPTETGEGLPGYLIDPAKLAIESKDNIRTVIGSAEAVRHPQGEAVRAKVLLIKVSKSSKIQRQNQDWQLTGTLLASAETDAQGAFKIQGIFTGDELLFVKVEDAAGTQIQYKAGVVTGSTLWIDGTSAKALDASAAEQISQQVESAQAAAELARLVEQVKSTGQCRNCNLAGADFSSLDIAECDLSFSNLMGAKFVLSNIASCNFTNSNLSQVDFTQANMAGSNLTQADINAAVFTGANTDGVVGAQIPAK
jgi:hypothetical protein